MPKRIADDEDMPRRRRRGAEAIAVEADDERGLVMRVLLHSPKDMVAGALAVAAIGAIVTNALFLQNGPHPSPMFGTVVTMPPAGSPVVNPMPRPRPPEAATRSEAAPVEPKATEPKATEMKSADIRAVDTKTADPLTNLVKATSTAPVVTSAIPRPPAPIPVSSHSDLNPGGSRRVAAVQRALTEYGYGQLKPTGTIGADTQAAIIKFEHDRKIPATGQMSDRLVKELAAVIGHSID